MTRRLAIALLWAASGCTTPSFPVPPPQPESMSFHLTEPGFATFEADPNTEWANARVSVYDTDTGYGVIVPAADDGSVPETPSFQAQDGDRIFVTYELPDQAESLCLILHDGRSSSAFRCQ